MTWRLGVDTGGTFTDVIAFESETGEWRATKIWSDAGGVAEAINRAIEALKIAPVDVAAITYGTTAITNAIVENKLACVAFVSTKGFKDVLRIARQKRDHLYSFKAAHRAPPPVLEANCFEVDERCTHEGAIVKSVDEKSLALLLREIPPECEAVAVSFLHAYANGANEKKAAAILGRRFAHVSVSHEISPEAREYERSITTVLNAALLPLIRRLVSSLGNMSVPLSRLRFFHSAGGLISPELAERHPLTLGMSGPAAGALAASAVARDLKIPHAVGFDMGGTTTDCSLIVSGQAALSAEIRIGSVPIRQPTIAVQSIGAGGGSVVRYTNGRLTVGPESMGAKPGPACYLRGGTIPTLTDAAAGLGLIGAAAGFKRPVKVDVGAARQAFAALSQTLQISVEAAALGTIKVASASASRAIKAVTMQGGVDARACALIAFGGAGPMLAPFVAQEIGLQSIIVPDRSSALSAVGCLTADPLMTRQWTIRLKMAQATAETVERIVGGFLTSLRRDFHLMEDKGISAEETLVALLRYPGQSYEIEVPMTLPFSCQAVTADFQRLHDRAYGFTSSDPWEFVAIRISIKTRSPRLATAGETPASSGLELPATRSCFDGRTWIDTKQYRRDRLREGATILGPAVILDEMSTIVVPPGFAAAADGPHLRLHQRPVGGGQELGAGFGDKTENALA